MSVPSPARTAAEMAWEDRRRTFAKPFEAAIAVRERLQPASAPSELVTPGTSRAAASASRARASRTDASGSIGSHSSTSGKSLARRSLSARPQNSSSGTTRAMATARSTNSSSAASEQSDDEAIAWRLPIRTRRPRSMPSARSRFSGLPRR